MTSEMPNRRALRFDTLEEVLAEAERLSSVQTETVGNWTEGQIFSHVATVMEKSMDGFENRLPFIVRWVARLLKKRFLTRPMKSGFQIPSRFGKELLPKEVSASEGLEQLRRAIGRLQRVTKRAPSPVFGKMTVGEWDQLHCRHAELHLSFIVPVGSE